MLQRVFLFLLSFLFTVVVTPTTSWAAPIKNEKLFRLEFKGKVSYVLGTIHSFDIKKVDLSKVDRALTEVDEIILESDFRKQAPQVNALSYGFGQKPGELRLQLSVPANEVLLRLTKKEERDLLFSLKPGVIAQLIKERFARARAEMIHEYYLVNKTLTKEQLEAKYEKVTLSPAIYEMTELIYGRRLKDQEIHKLTVESTMTRSVTGVDHYVFARAVQLNKQVTFAEDNFRFENDKAVQFIGVKELDSILVAMDKLLESKTASTQFWSRLIVSTLTNLWYEQFFNLSSQQIARLQDLVEQLMVADKPMLPGEEKISLAILNRHKDWIGAIVKKVKKGRVFIAVGAAHVIPDIASGSVGTLLEEFEKRGVKITPIEMDSMQTCPEALK